MSLLCLDYWNYFTTFSSISIVGFEQVKLVHHFEAKT